MSEPAGRGDAWTEERGTSDEGRRRLRAPRWRADGARGQMTHPEAEVLAEFRAGLITGRRGARITAHLAGCDRCTALDDQLAGVSALLASVPPLVMPDSLTQRLDTVLAAEAARQDRVGADRAGAGQVATDQAERGRADGPAHPATGRKRTPRPSFRLLSARVLAPVAVALLAVGGYGLSQIAGPGGQVTTSSGAATGGSGAASSAQSAQAAAPTAASSHANAPKSPIVRGTAGSAPQARRLTFSMTASTVDFSADPATLKRQVKHELSTASPAAGSVTARPVTTRLRECVQNLTRGATLVRVESARFQGKPAILVVTRTGPDEVAWIAGKNCSATSRDILATTTIPAGTSGP
jgi:hypothetical protein